MPVVVWVDWQPVSLNRILAMGVKERIRAKKAARRAWEASGGVVTLPNWLRRVLGPKQGPQ